MDTSREVSHGSTNEPLANLRTHAETPPYSARRGLRYPTRPGIRGQVVIVLRLRQLELSSAHRSLRARSARTAGAILPEITCSFDCRTAGPAPLMSPIGAALRPAPTDRAEAERCRVRSCVRRPEVAWASGGGSMVGGFVGRLQGGSRVGCF